MIKVLLAIPTICDCFPPTINEINIGGIYPLAEAELCSVYSPNSMLSLQFCASTRMCVYKEPKHQEV